MNYELIKQNEEKKPQTYTIKIINLNKKNTCVKKKK